ncbi:MAG: ornithine cyclodeaminase family protein [Methylobacter sp.]
MRFIDEATIAGVLTMHELIPAMRQTMIDFSRGLIDQPPRRMSAVQPHGGFFGSMPAASSRAVGAKLVTFYPDNPEKNLPAVMATIVLFKPETGEPLATLDGRLITEMRTAAVTAAFIDAVAAPDVKSLAILGAGAQGRRHIEALCCVRQFEDIRIWNRTPQRAEKLAEDVGGKAMFIEEAVRDADVVVVATSSTEPVLEGRWLSPGAKVASVGWAGADCAEVDAEAMSHVVVVDSREGTREESGNIRQFNAPIYAELGEVLAGTTPIDPDATVIFDSIGMACEDVAAAMLIYDKLTSSPDAA